MLKCIETPTNQDAELLLVEIYSSGVEIHRSGVLLNPSLILLQPQSLPLGSKSFWTHFCDSPALIKKALSFEYVLAASTNEY